MHDIVPFQFENNSVRVIRRDGTGWFVLADVCQVLEVANHRDAATRLDDDEKDGVGIADTIGRKQQMTIINESGLYALILTSRKPAAKRFRKWVTAEVLPSIRRTGAYAVPGAAVAPVDLSIREKLAIAVGHKRVFGSAATRALWAKLGLPLAEPEDDPRPDPDEWMACLRHLDHVTGLLARLNDGTAGVDPYPADLASWGLKLDGDRLAVANGAVSVFIGSEWQDGAHIAVLRRAPGVSVPTAPIRVAGVKTRVTLVPVALIRRAVEASRHEIGGQ